MILSCPKCQVKYDIPQAYFAQGKRRVRCSNCSFEWEHRDPESEKRAGTEAYRGGQADARDDAKVADDQKAREKDLGFYVHESEDLSRPQTAPARPAGLIVRPAVQAACLVSFLIALSYVMSGSIVTAIPALASGYRAVGIDPVGQYKDWNICFADISDDAVQVRFENKSAMGRLIPALTWADAGFEPGIDPSDRFVDGGSSVQITFESAGGQSAATVGNRSIGRC